MATEVTAVLRRQRSSAQKVRLVIDSIRGARVEQALDQLIHGRTKASVLVRKTLESAVANAENNHGLDIDSLIIVRACADVAHTLKRFRARARGRGARILKRSCHITIVVSEKERGN
jgi:large subunit ribosomal protein L22